MAGPVLAEPMQAPAADGVGAHRPVTGTMDRLTVRVPPLGSVPDTPSNRFPTGVHLRLPASERRARPWETCRRARILSVDAPGCQDIGVSVANAEAYSARPEIDLPRRHTLR